MSPTGCDRGRYSHPAVLVEGLGIERGFLFLLDVGRVLVFISGFLAHTNRANCLKRAYLRNITAKSYSKICIVNLGHCLVISVSVVI